MSIWDKLKKKFVRQKTVEEKVKEKDEHEVTKKEDLFVNSLFIGEKGVEKRLEKIEKMLEELLEIKELYKDMLDWMIERAKSRNRDSSRQIETSPDTIDLSPRLRQVLEIVKEKGEALASDVSQITGLSQNRCSELLNALFKAGYLEKVRKGREVYYRVRME